MFARAVAVAAILISSSFVAHAAPDELIVGPAFVIAGSHATETQLAASETAFLVVWTDNSGPSRDVRGQLVRSDGVLMGSPFAIAAGPTEEFSPAVATDGVGFLVAWVQDTQTADGQKFSEVRATRIAPEGGILDPGGFPVLPHQPADWPVWGVSVRLAWNGQNWLAAWHYRQPYEGTVLTLIAPAGNVVSSKSLAWDADWMLSGNASGFYYISGNEDSSAEYPGGRLLGGDLAPLGGSGFPEVTTPIAIATDGLDYLLVFACGGASDAHHASALGTCSLEIDGTTGLARQASRTPTSGILPARAPGQTGPQYAAAFRGDWLIAREFARGGERSIVLGDATLFSSAWSPEIAVAGHSGLAIATRGDDIAAKTFRYASGWPLPPPAVVPTPPPGQPVIEPLGDEETLPGARFSAFAASSDRFLIAWSDYAASHQQVYGRILLGETGEWLGDPFVIANSSDAQDSSPSVSSDGTDFLIVWRHDGGPAPSYAELRGARITSTGENLDPGGFLVVVPWAGGHWTNPQSQTMLWVGDKWLMVWNDMRLATAFERYGIWITRDGILGDAFDVGPGSGEARLAWNNTNIYYEYEFSGAAGALMNLDGTFVGSSRLSVDSWSGFGYAAVATDGKDFRVVDQTSTGSTAVEIDGKTGWPREWTRTFVSTGRTAIAYLDRWVIAREENPDIHVEAALLLPGARLPRLAAVGTTGLVVAQRGNDAVVRRFHAGAPLPTPTPDSTPAPDGTPSAPSDPGRIVVHSGDTSAGTANCSCAMGTSTGGNDSLLALASLGAAAILIRRKRGRAFV